MRLFVGIPIKPELANLIHQWRNENPLGKIRWIADHNLHITLVPPWNVKDPQEVISLLEQVSFSPFSLRFEYITIGPDSRPRLMWAKAELNEEIRMLRESIHVALGQKIKARPFVPHITVGKFRAQDEQKLVLPELPDPIDWQMKIDSFVLYESQLSPQGSEYRILYTKSSSRAQRGDLVHILLDQIASPAQQVRNDTKENLSYLMKWQYNALMHDEEMLVSFSVDCPSNNVSRVRNLLIDLGMTSIVASENHIHGVCEMSELQEVMRIVGGHHDIEVMTSPYNPKKVVN